MPRTETDLSQYEPGPSASPDGGGSAFTSKMAANVRDDLRRLPEIFILQKNFLFHYNDVSNSITTQGRTNFIWIRFDFVRNIRILCYLLGISSKQPENIGRGLIAHWFHDHEGELMHLGPRLTAFVRDCYEVTDEFALRTLLDEVTKSLGFDQFALVNHVDLAGPPQGAMVLISYEDEWVHRALTKRYYVDDPIHAASTRTLTSFLWRDVPDMLPLTQRQCSPSAPMAQI